MSEQKDKIRQRLKRKRLSIAKEEVRARSRVICNKLLDSIDWARVQSLHIYQSVPVWHEVDTYEIIENLKTIHPKIEISVGKPEKDQEFPHKQFDIIVVPVLGFDSNNNRLGLGKGWYDRFLASQPQARKIGLAFSESLVRGSLPHEPHDIQLDSVITEV